MESQNKTDLEIISSANKEMLDYFNALFLDQLEDIQNLKTQSFEIDIKIDELEKTKDIYAFKSNSRISAFTPNINDDTSNVRGQIIDEQIEDLRSVQESLITKLRSMEIKLHSLKRRLNTLNQAQESINKLTPGSFSFDDGDEEEGFVFIETDSSQTTNTAHGHNILMQDAFDNAFLSTLLERNVKNNMLSVNNKLELLTYLLGTDVSRARLTLKEIILSAKETLDSVDDVIFKLSGGIDSGSSLWLQLEDYIMLKRDQYPEYLIDSSIDCYDDEASVHPVFVINTMKLIDIFMDNIFKHSNANHITFSLNIKEDTIECDITDNGIGIKDNYLTSSPWYSSLHKAHEIIYLLEGKLNISGDITKGTRVHFDFATDTTS